MQAGSSIMPGKVNPVIPEVVNQIAFEVIGNDVTVTFAAEAGQLQLNAFEPIIAHSLFKSFKHLRNGCLTLADRCVNGITANREQLRRERRALDRHRDRAQSVSSATRNATEVAAEAFANGTNVREVVLRRKLMTEAELEDALRHEVLTQPRAYEKAQKAH